MADKRPILRTPPGICSFPQLFKAVKGTFKGSEDKDPLFSTTIIFDNSVDLSEIEKEIEWHRKDTFGSRKKGLKHPIIDGTKYAEDHENNDHLEGMKFLRLSTKFRPDVLTTERDENGNFTHVDPDDPEGIYPGAIIRCSVNFYTYDEPTNRGVGIGLCHVQKIADGDRLVISSSGQRDFDDDFDDIPF